MTARSEGQLGSSRSAERRRSACVDHDMDAPGAEQPDDLDRDVSPRGLRALLLSGRRTASNFHDHLRWHHDSVVTILRWIGSSTAAVTSAKPGEDRQHPAVSVVGLDESEFVHDVADVGFHRALGEPQPAGDAGVGPALGHQS